MTASFNLRLVKPFVVLADQDLHFGEAAQRLGIGQPGLSRQIARLQHQVRTSLVVRRGRRTMLTAAGSRFLVHARAVLQRADALLAELRADTLRLHMGVGAHRGAQSLVAAYMTAHPHTRVEIIEGLSSDVRRLVLRRAADVGFELRTSCPDDLRFEPLDQSPLGLLAAREHPLVGAGTPTWDALTGARILFGANPDGSWNALVRSALATAGITVIEEIAPRVARLHYLLPIIANGEVCMITGRGLFDPLPDTVTWTPLTPHRFLEYGAIWDPRHSRPSVEQFVRFLRQPTAGPATAMPTDLTTPPARPDTPTRSGACPTTVTDVPSATPFDLQLVRPFVTAAEEMHFSRAATRLMIAQPALSRHVARLESQLAVTLFLRSSRTITLTDAGRLTLAAGREILDHALRAQIAAEPNRATVNGRLRFHTSYAGHPVLVRLMGSFAADHPEIEVQLSDGGRLTAAAAIAAGVSEMGVGFAGAVPVELSYLKFASTEQGFYCAQSHPLAGRATICWRDLDGESLFVARPGVTDEYNAWLRGKLDDYRVTVIEVAAPGKQAALIVNSLVKGVAGVVSARHFFRSVPELRWVPFSPPEYLEQGVIWNDRTAGPPVRAFLRWTGSSGTAPDLRQ